MQNGGSGEHRRSVRHRRHRVGQLHREPDHRQHLLPGPAGQGREGRSATADRQPRDLLPGDPGRSIDLIPPEYTGGTLLQYINKNATETEPDAVYNALKAALPANLTVTDKSAAEDKDAVVVTQETATKYNAKSIEDLAANCGQIVFGGPPEFQTRPDGIPGIQKTYNCTFKEYKALDAGGPLTVAALKNGDIQAADIFTTDASIVTNNFVVLTDPKDNFAAQNVVPLITKAKATGDHARRAEPDLGEAHHRRADQAQRGGLVRREAVAGDRRQELAVAERFLTLTRRGGCRYRRFALSCDSSH